MAGKKSGLITVILSLLIAGAGHMYIGAYKKAALFFVYGEILSLVLYLYVDQTGGEIWGLLSSAYAAYDSYRTVSALNVVVPEDKGYAGPEIRV